MNEEDPEVHLPLTAPVFHVLLALAGGDKHGYAIMKDVKLRTGGEVRLSAGTLYGLIKRLLASSMISEAQQRSGQGFSDSRRRTYRLEPFGRQVVRAEAARLERMVTLARAQNLLDSPRPV